jgi:HSP20 family molecular chaperone IbpA
MPQSKSVFDSDAAREMGATNAASVVINDADGIKEQPADATPATNESSANNRKLQNSAPTPTPPESPVTAKSLAPSKPVVPLPKLAADKLAEPPPPAAPQPSLPVSMTIRPDSAAGASYSSLLPGEAEESFESALQRVEFARPQKTLAARILAGIHELISSSGGGYHQTVHLQRLVAFDGFRNDLFEDKRERDRRYGTVYTVSEELNAFLVRLEMPRRMPKSSLKQTWELPDKMPDYACTITLADNVLSIRASLPDEARRRLSYISSSFPSDFQTRIEFQTPVVSYKHRLQNKVLEIIVNKRASIRPARKSSWQPKG